MKLSELKKQFWPEGADRVNLFQKMLDMGADATLSLTDSSGKSALDYACSSH